MPSSIADYLSEHFLMVYNHNGLFVFSTVFASWHSALPLLYPSIMSTCKKQLGSSVSNYFTWLVPYNHKSSVFREYVFSVVESLPNAHPSSLYNWLPTELFLTQFKTKKQIQQLKRRQSKICSGTSRNSKKLFSHSKQQVNIRTIYWCHLIWIMTAVCQESSSKNHDSKLIILQNITIFFPYLPGRS